MIDGVKPWDGRYSFDAAAEPLTVREWGWLKRLTGYFPGTVAAGFDGGDPELFAALAAIALRRHGRIGTGDVEAVFERLLDAPADAVLPGRDTDDEAAGDADGPPPSSSSGSNGFSGDASPPSSEISPPTPVTSGTPGSATSGSGPATSLR